jgi:hypothetical protein
LGTTQTPKESTQDLRFADRDGVFSEANDLNVKLLIVKSSLHNGPVAAHLEIQVLSANRATAELVETHMGAFVAKQ